MMIQSLRYKASSYYTFWLRGQAVKTSPFHGGNTGSIPVGVTKLDYPVCVIYPIGFTDL